MSERAAQPPPCPICHGSGQLSSFKGVSRFLLTTEECPACDGTGLQLDAEGKQTASRQPTGPGEH